MQDIVFYAAVLCETQGIVRDSANARNQSAPVLVLGVSACLKMRLFAACNVATPYPVASCSGISDWIWRMDADFERDTPSKLVADADGIFVHTVTDTVDGKTVNFTEFVIPISNMNTQELTTWIGSERKRSGLTGELIGYDSAGNAVFVLQIDDFTVSNRVGGLGDPTAIEQEVATRSQTAQMIQAAVSASAATKQDKLTSANAGTNISIDANGVISNTYSLPSATTGSRGGVMLATTAETISGSNATKAITPATFLSALSGNDQIIAKTAIQAFQPITELGSASTVSLKSGGAYRLFAVSGNHYLTVTDVPADKYGMDAHMELFIGNTSLIHVYDPLILMDALIPNAVNDCVIKFRDGTARMFVEDHAYGYVVTVAGGTDGTDFGGSLYRGLTEADNSYISFANSLNGQTVILPETATINRAVNVVGNGYTETVISGGISCTSKTTFSNLGMNGVSVLGGTATLGDVFIPSGATVSVSGGGLAVEKVTGDGGTIDLGGTHVTVSAGGSAIISGAVFAGGSASSGGAFLLDRATLAMSDTTISGCSASSGGAMFLARGSVLSAARVAFLDNQAETFYHINIENSDAEFSSCTQSGGAAGALYIQAVGAGSSATATITDCEFSSLIKVNAAATVLNIAGTNTLATVNGAGSVTISSGASINLASSIAPSGGVTFEQGGATIIPGGTASLAYTLGGMTVPQLGNANVVNLSGTYVTISSGMAASASGCTFTSGYGGSVGAITVAKGGVLTITSCFFASNTNNAAGAGNGKALNIAGGVVYVNNCFFDATTLQDIAFSNQTNGGLIVDGGTLYKVFFRTDSNSITLAGDCNLDMILGDNTLTHNKVTISSGASINLTSSIAPGGGITLYGGHYEAPTTIIGSGGVSRTFEDLEIKGSTINNAGLIFGATIYSNEGDDHEVRYTEDGGVTSSSVFISGQTAFAVPGGLMQVLNT